MTTKAPTLRMLHNIVTFIMERKSNYRESHETWK